MLVYWNVSVVFSGSKFVFGFFPQTNQVSFQWISVSYIFVAWKLSAAGRESLIWNPENAAVQKESPFPGGFFRWTILNFKGVNGLTESRNYQNVGNLGSLARWIISGQFTKKKHNLNVSAILGPGFPYFSLPIWADQPTTLVGGC